MWEGHRGEKSVRVCQVFTSSSSPPHHIEAAAELHPSMPARATQDLGSELRRRQSKAPNGDTPNAQVLYGIPKRAKKPMPARERGGERKEESSWL